MTATLDPATTEGARALGSLATDKTGWITTVDGDGQPQSSPIWFLWDGGEILIYSHKRARRNAYLAKYEPHILAYGWTADWFAAEYPVALRITPTRWRVG